MKNEMTPHTHEETRARRSADRGLGLFITVALGTAVLILFAAAIWFWRG